MKRVSKNKHTRIGDPFLERICYNIAPHAFQLSFCYQRNYKAKCGSGRGSHPCRMGGIGAWDRWGNGW